MGTKVIEFSCVWFLKSLFTVKIPFDKWGKKNKKRIDRFWRKVTRTWLMTTMTRRDQRRRVTYSFYYTYFLLHVTYGNADRSTLAPWLCCWKKRHTHAILRFHSDLTIIRRDWSRINCRVHRSTFFSIRKYMHKADHFLFTLIFWHTITCTTEQYECDIFETKSQVNCARVYEHSHENLLSLRSSSLLLTR